MAEEKFAAFGKVPRYMKCIPICFAQRARQKKNQELLFAGKKSELFRFYLEQLLLSLNTFLQNHRSYLTFTI
jgi:hypothetical protein